MNVTVESLAPCKKLVRVEVAAQEVDQAFDDMIKDFQRQVSFPGFRPGKAPRDMVAKRHEKEIQEEVRKKLIPKAYQEAVETHKLDVIGKPDLEEVQFGRGQAMQLAIKIETAPEFTLPEYKGLAAKRETSEVTDADVEKAIEMLRGRETKFETVARELATGDVAVVNYTGTVDGQPITNLAPTAKGLTEQKGFWIQTEGNSFIPGFAEQLLGAKAGDQRTVTVDFPADFVTPQLANLKGVYEVELVEVKAKLIPALDDEFAKRFETENLEKLREGVRRDLENELQHKKHRSVRNQLVSELLSRVDFELPEFSVATETRNVVYNIVNENQKRGVGKEVIEEQKDAIYSVANTSAKTRVKANFMLRKIAEVEGIKVSQDEVKNRVFQLASMYEIPVDKFVQDLQKRDGIVEIYDQLSYEKVLDLLETNAAIQDVPPGSLEPEAQ